MKKFVFATYDCFENELKLSIVEGESAVDILRSKLFPNNEPVPEDVEETVEGLCEYAYSCDMPMEIMEVPQ